MSVGITARPIAAAAAVVVSALAAVTTAAAGYGPFTPPGLQIPGGFSTLIASKTFGLAGGTLAARAGQTHFELRVQRGALRSRIQLTLTHPRLANLRTRVPHGTVPATGVALLATRPNGDFVSGFGSSQVRLEVVDAKITARSIALIWNQRTGRFVRYPATIIAGKATFKLNRTQELVVASPK